MTDTDQTVCPACGTPGDDDLSRCQMTGCDACWTTEITTTDGWAAFVCDGHSATVLAETGEGQIAAVNVVDPLPGFLLPGAGVLPADERRASARRKARRKAQRAARRRNR